jgi:hypothetical protein
MDDEYDTPVDRPPVRHASDEAFRVAYASTLLAAISSELAAIGAVLDALTPTSRVDRIRDLAKQIAATGRGLTELSESICSLT